METALAPVQQTNLSGAASDTALVELWLRQYKSVATNKNYRRIAYALLDGMRKPLANITAAELQTYLDGLSHLAPATQRLTAMAIKSLFSFATRLGYLRFNVAAVLKAPKAENSVTHRILSEGEVLSIIRSAKRPRDKVIFWLLYEAGLRVSELCNLRWRDVEALDDGDAVLSVIGKGGKLRHVRIDASLYAEMLRLKPKSVGDYIFTSQKNTRISPQQVWTLLKNTAKTAGIDKKPSPHWLRHCNATHSLRRGMSVKDVAEVLGHSSIAVTSRYLHASPDRKSANYLPRP